MENPLGQRRNVFPRWRSLERTSSAELGSDAKLKPLLDADTAQERLRFFYEKWRAKPSITNASEVIDCALLVKNPFLAVGPAKALLDSDAMPAAKAVANFVLNGPEIADPEVSSSEGSRFEIGAKIRVLKARAIEEPGNALVWLEKARLHTLIGDLNSGKLAIRRAFGSAPDNRFVLRSLARFMVHTGHADEGHDVLRKSERLKYDPWLQAAEIALADVAEVDPVSVRTARELLEDGAFSPTSLSELASALGTLEAREGNRRARKHVRQSLTAPTENALSQAFWIRDELAVNVQIENSMLTLKGAFEARVRSALEGKRWSTAIANCRRWLGDEPFSIRAATEGSYIASSLLWSSETSLEFCDEGLIANPDEQMLLNNKVVALCRLGRLAEAKRVLDRLLVLAGKQSDPIVLATTGLFHFSSKNPMLGREYYYRSVEKARVDEYGDVEFRAIAHWLYEEVSAGTMSLAMCNSVFEKMDKIYSKRLVRPLSLEIWKELKNRIEMIASQKQTSAAEVQHQLLLEQIDFSASHELVQSDFRDA